MITNNAQDFEFLHESHNHSGIFLYHDHDLPDEDPEGLARTVEEVLNQYGLAGVENELVYLDEWYNWLQNR